MAPSSLDDLLERRRKACATFESQPSETTADAFSHSGPFQQHAGKKVVVKHEDESCHHRDLGELKLLLAERHGRCHVLQNNPKARQADAIWNVAHTEGAESENLESLPGKHVADFRYEAQPILLSQKSTSRPSASPVEQSEASTVTSEKMQVIREVEERMIYLKFEEDHLVNILCMFLRYHDPETICQIERCKSDGLSLTDLHDLCISTSPLAFFLGKLDLSDSNENFDIKTATCVGHLCTLLVDTLKLERSETSQLEVRTFFLLLAAFRNAWRSSNGRKSGEKATALPVQMAQLLWEEAAGMLDATPRSLWYLCHSVPMFTVKMPICRVAADEVLQHIYERPSMDWRLVVLDARKHNSQPDMALPVCLQVDQEMMDTQLPRDEQIHLCIVGDDVDHAQMLAEHLVTQKMCHISLVEGGWEAIEHLVAALGLELLPPSPQKEPKDGDKLDRPEVADDLQGSTTWMAQSIQSWTPWAAWHSWTPTTENELLDL